VPVIVVDRLTGEVRQAQIFVAVSPPGWDTPLTPAHRINNSRLGGVNDIAVDFTQRKFVVFTLPYR
jgi:hypothetical protein